MKLTTGQIEEFQTRGVLIAKNALLPMQDLQPVIDEISEFIDHRAHANSRQREQSKTCMKMSRLKPDTDDFSHNPKRLVVGLTSCTTAARRSLNFCTIRTCSMSSNRLLDRKSSATPSNTCDLRPRLNTMKTAILLRTSVTCTKTPGLSCRRRKVRTLSLAGCHWVMQPPRWGVSMFCPAWSKEDICGIDPGVEQIFFPKTCQRLTQYQWLATRAIWYS